MDMKQKNRVIYCLKLYKKYKSLFVVVLCFSMLLTILTFLTFILYCLEEIINPFLILVIALLSIGFNVLSIRLYKKKKSLLYLIENNKF